MLNLSRIQLELERAKEKLRSVEETIQKVEGKTFSNGPVRYGGLKAEYHTDKIRNPAAPEDANNIRRRNITSGIDSRIQRLPSDDPPFNLKRNLREKGEPGLAFKRQAGDARPQGVFARLSGVSYHQADEEEEDDLGKKPTLPSQVYTTATEVPSRQEVIAAQAQDEQSKERNKRMFGALVGTLQKFRKEETRVREREEKRMKVEKKLEEDAKREKEKLMQEKRELFLEKKRREVEIKRIEWSLNRVKEYEAWEANVLPLKNFIQTQAKPHIFYLPSIHNAKTEERFAHSQKLVEKMIEKRKTNLKEEIENSEKKARKAAAEDAEEEEAENIPEGNEESCSAEQQIQADFEPKNTENGFYEDGKKAESPKGLEEAKETVKEEENWDKIQEPGSKEPEDVLENKKESCCYDKEESKEESQITDKKDSNNDLNSISEERVSDKTGKDQLDESENGKEEKKHEIEDDEDDKRESNDINAEEHPTESLEANENVEVHPKKTDNIEKNSEKNIVQEATCTDLIKSVPVPVKSVENLEPNPNQKTESKPLSESEPKTEKSSKKKLESHDEKKKTEGSLVREKTESKKSGRRSRSPKKSRSPRNFSRNKRRRSSSRQRRICRRPNSSNSPPRKSRRSRSPVLRRGQRNFSSKKRSPHSKSKKRKSSSRSSSPSSLRKKKSRSSSSTSSKSE